MPNQYSTQSVELICGTCESPFTVQAYRAATAKRCSRTCKRVNAPKTECAECGVVFEIRRRVNYEKRFCAVSCYRAFQVRTFGDMNRTHAHAKPAQRTPEYRSWALLRGRCLSVNNPKYPSYGGRGITVCAAWTSFAQFLADMGERPSADHSIDRIDNNGPYSPENCRWATRSQQARNKRNTWMITCNGETRPAVEWAEMAGIGTGTIRVRLKRGWSLEKAISTRTTNHVAPSVSVP
jgi:hypothetical protein